MSSRGMKQVGRTPTGGMAPRRALAVKMAKRSAPKCGGVKEEKGVRTEITAVGGDEHTRAGERERKRKGVTEEAGGRKRTIESIMSGDGEVVKDGVSGKSGRPVGECRKRKAGRKWITGTTTSSSSSSSDEDEADVRDGTDVLEYESRVEVIPSSLKDTESEEEEDNEKDPRAWKNWKAACICKKGTLQGDCGCDAGF